MDEGFERKEYHNGNEFLNKSVLSTLLEHINDWTKYLLLDKKECRLVICSDFSKAFDMGDRSKLLYNIENLKFHPLVVYCIKEYLIQRSFQVKVAHSLFFSKSITIVVL